MSASRGLLSDRLTEDELRNLGTGMMGEKLPNPAVCGVGGGIGAAGVGDLTVPQAFAFLGVQLTAGLGILLQLNWYRSVYQATSKNHIPSTQLMNCLLSLISSRIRVLHHYLKYSGPVHRHPYLTRTRNGKVQFANRFL